jgi:hypothetical protein
MELFDTAAGRVYTIVVELKVDDFRVLYDKFRENCKLMRNAMFKGDQGCQNWVWCL